MLKFKSDWRFESPGTIPADAVKAFAVLISQIASQGESRKGIFEHFKEYFAGASGTVCGGSSSTSYAESDMQVLMRHAAENSALFIDAFYGACEKLRKEGDVDIPEVETINKILRKHEVPFAIQPPNLVSIADDDDEPIVETPKTPSSLDDKARAIIEKSYADSAELLSEGRDRLAVQEILWLLETVSTAFQGIQTRSGSVEGKYFNKIVQDLKQQHKNTTLAQVINWITTLHAYLSAPGGGGIRHGAQLKSGVVVKKHEARLYCNLIRSYIGFLLDEHHRLTGKSKVLDK